MSTMRETVIGEWDAVVIGGGIAGLAAARTAAKHGMKTALIEASGALGREIGRARSMFIDLERHAARSATIAAWLEGLRRKQGWFAAGGIDTCCSEAVFDEMLEEAGVEVWFQLLPAQLLVANGAVNGLRIAAKNGYSVMRAPLVIDASADGKIARSVYAAKPAQLQGGAIHLLYNHVAPAAQCPAELSLTLPSFGEVKVRCRATFWPGEWRVSLYTAGALTRHQYALLVRTALEQLHRQITVLNDAVLSHVAADAWTAPGFALQADGFDATTAVKLTDGSCERLVPVGALHNEQAVSGLMLAGGWLEPFPFSVVEEEQTIIQLAQLGEAVASLRSSALKV